MNDVYDLSDLAQYDQLIAEAKDLAAQFYDSSEAAERQKREQEQRELENSSINELLTHSDPRVRAVAKACSKDLLTYA